MVPGLERRITERYDAAARLKEKQLADQQLRRYHQQPHEVPLLKGSFGHSAGTVMHHQHGGQGVTNDSSEESLYGIDRGGRMPMSESIVMTRY